MSLHDLRQRIFKSEQLGKLFRRTGAELLCDSLQKNGVKQVFGIPGMHNLYLYEILRRRSMRIVTATHEQATGFMAIGATNITGRPGVILTTPGPGLTNSLTSIAEARLDSIPIVVVSTDVRCDLAFPFQLHSIPQVQLCTPLVKAVLNVQTVHEIGDLTTRAFSIAQEADPGPVVLNIPANLLWESTNTQFLTPAESIPKNSLSDPADLKQALNLIQHKQRICILAGQGCRDEIEMLCELAEWLHAPVLTTLHGRGCLDESHPLSLGSLWHPEDVEPINQLLQTCDMTLVLGARYSEMSMRGFQLRLPAPIIRIDASQQNLEQDQISDMKLCMTTKEFLRQTLARKTDFDSRRDIDLPLRIHQLKKQMYRSLEQASVSLNIGGKSYSPEQFFHQLQGVSSLEAVFVSDVGYHELLAIRNLKVSTPGRLIVPSDYQAMGFGIPAALGAAIVAPQQQLIVFVGDGGFLMSGMELLTGVREQVNLLVVLFNDGAYGYLRKMQYEAYGHSSAVDVTNPDYRMLAESCHIQYIEAENNLHDTLLMATRMQGLRLLEVGVSWRKRLPVTTLPQQIRVNLRDWLNSRINYEDFRRRG